MQKVESVSLFFSFQGVSILVTSVTDVCAFFIGATTVSYFSESICYQDMFSNQNTQRGIFEHFYDLRNLLENFEIPKKLRN